MLESELKFIEEAQQGDTSAFGRLYDHYLPKIYRFIFLKVSNRSEAEDLSHEVFLSAWQNIGSYAPMGYSFSSWIYQIARNRVIDFYRTKKQHLNIDDLEDYFFKVPAQQATELITKTALEEVRRLITELSPDQQDVLIMRFVEDMEHKEIAAALDKSEGAVRILQHRAIQQLKKLINKKHGSSDSSFATI